MQIQAAMHCLEMFHMDAVREEMECLDCFDNFPELKLIAHVQYIIDSIWSLSIIEFHFSKLKYFRTCYLSHLHERWRCSESNESSEIQLGALWSKNVVVELNFHAYQMMS